MHQLPSEIGHRGEHAAGNDVALDLGNQSSTWFSHDEYVGV